MMEKKNKPANYYLRYFAVLFIFYAVILFAGSFIFKNKPSVLYFSFLIILTGEFIITYGIHFLTTWASERSVQFFGRIYMVLSFLKILLYISIIFGLLMIYKQYLIPIVVTFFTVYFLFRIFDLIILFKFFKEKK